MAPLIESAALVILLRTGSHRWQQYAELVEENGSAVAALEAERGENSRLFDPSSPPGDEDLLERTAAEIKAWQADGMRLVTVLDPDYPENLRTVHDRPPLIFLAGQLEPADNRSVAVVGSRQASSRGVAAAGEIGAHLVASGYTVVSGLAAGIDAAAHSAAIEHGGRTVAVIGTGLRRVYPPQHASLQRQVIETGAVISQFWPDAPPSKRSFPMRNAVMSGLTLASVVVEASYKSGSRMQARLALAHGRPVFLVRQLLEQQWARELASRPGTYVVSSPQEITAAVERLTSADTLVP